MNKHLIDGDPSVPGFHVLFFFIKKENVASITAPSHASKLYQGEQKLLDEQPIKPHTDEGSVFLSVFLYCIVDRA